MAITLAQQRKKQKYLALILIVVVLIILVVLLKGFLFRPKIQEPTEIVKPSLIEIDFEALKNPVLQSLEPYEEILPLEDEIGRENPFVPY